ncbi:lipopolysaccharide biosynthesis protein [Oceanobacillus bengalensis]|uniref:Teichoic acid transporter n=1 Tax=Oceanobacillus bengalensis TaxID=1435466 RepID=A0A494YSJ6_9BACI|nr:oligosaccharide flippase family protein [Oceanobacillus bengalensis]RKQ12958.1 teichoic acid transporter [Oceanobacillus bengalensis]
MKSQFIKFTKKPFVRNVIILSTGTAAAQVVTMLLSPFITRIYGPEAFGLMGTFNTIISIIVPIVALTYPIAIVLPKHDSEAHGIIRLSIFITTIVAIFSGILLLFFHQKFLELFQLEEIASYLYLIPIIIFSAGILQVIEQWLIRTRQFSVSAKVTFVQALIINSGKVGVGLFSPVASILIIFSACTQGLKAFLLLIFTRNTKARLPSVIFRKSTSSKGLAKKYKDFPLFRAPQSIVNSISEGIPVLMLSSFFGAASVGFYSIGRSVLNVPTQLIGKSVGDVFYPKISTVANSGESVSKMLLKATLILIGIGILPFGFVILFGPFLFSLVYGSEWLLAGEYARWIALWSFSSFILQPVVRTLPVIMAQRFHLVYTIFSLLIRISMLAIGYFWFSSDIIAISLFGASSGLLNLILIIITLILCRRFDRLNRVR